MLNNLVSGISTARASPSVGHALRVAPNLVVAAAVLTTPLRIASAQQWEGCEDHAQMVSKLTNKYHEEREAVATSHYGWLVELFMSPDGKTWTFVETRPNGPACVAAEGSDWQVVQSTKGQPM